MLHSLPKGETAMMHQGHPHFNNNNTTVVLLNGSNFKKWKQDIEFALGIVDLDLALREPEPATLTDTSIASEKESYAKWDRSNRLSLLAIKRSIPEHLLTGLPETNNAKVLFEAIGQRYQVSSKAETGSLMNELMSLSLPSEFSQIKIAYNTQNESWTVNELIAKQGHGNRKNYKKPEVNTSHKGQDNKNHGQTRNLLGPNATIKKGIKCFFCKKEGHIKKDYHGFKSWLEKKKDQEGGIQKQTEAKHDVTGQHMGPFAKYLQECGIIAQYTMPGSPKQNSAAVFFSKSNKTSNGPKHIEIKDLVRKGDIIIEHIDTEQVMADPLTKGLRPITFSKHVSNMGVIGSFDAFG
ncbi:hypothetical protein Acr_06g0010030 [Actinidia rufa]|uniref:Uncharacterized protein n=1 Tax=Actinidia rufa TaxID=165716 RepID=A0A7J0ERK0_9ERIC|nr:hypothetical protein Acr_06g0010030 [Actinidia rufa]